MFHRAAQWLGPSLGRSAKLGASALRLTSSTSPRCYGVGIPFSAAKEATMPSSSFLGNWTLMRSALPINTPQVAAPNLISSELSLRAVTPGLVGSCNAQQTRGFASKKHKRVIKLSKGFRGRANRCFRVAIRRLEKSWQYAYRDRKVKKREFRKLWIQRLNAGVRQHGISYSRFIEMQGKSGVTLDRKILSGLAMYEPLSFKAVVDVVKKVSATGN